MSGPARRLILALAGCAATLPAPMHAQGLALRLGHLFRDGGWTSYGATWQGPIAGPAGFGLGGVLVQGPAPASARLWGGTAEVSLFRGGRPGIYAMGALSGGIGTDGAESWWSAWSAGLGYELLPLPALSLGIETRYHQYGAHQRSGLELSLRLGANFGGGSRAPRTRPDAAPPPAPFGDAAATGHSLARSDAQRLLDGVIATADSVIGTRYRLGGVDGGGFDCSGLIQYAYARHGIRLPRRSMEQAAAGREVGRDVASLQPGDLLTFSNSGHGVTHVGMYIGDGRFIHSASTGVQTSQLTENDPYGKWWYKRWVGVRRIVE